MRKSSFLAFLVYPCIIAAFAFLAYATSEFVVMRGVNGIELRQAREGMQQLRRYLHSAEVHMQRQAEDWACWDQAYAFMENRSLDFISENFSEGSLRDLRISAAALYRTDREAIFFTDISSSSGDPRWMAEERHLFDRVAHLLLSASLPSMEGFVSVRGVPFVLSAHQVYDTDKSLPPRGVLILSSPLDEDFVAEARHNTLRRFSLQPAASFGALPVEADGDTGFKILWGQLAVRVYSMVFDAFGKAAFTMELRLDRDVAAMGREMAHRNFILILGLGVALLLAGLLFQHLAERRAMTRELAHRASHDGLTGLGNKKLLGAHLREVMARTARDGRLAGLLLLDLDRFKGVNESYGHDTGDQLLRRVARRLDALAGRGDCVARSGGDEFIIATDAVRSRAELAELAERVLGALSRSFTLDNDAVAYLSASIGIAVFPNDGKSLATLLRHAELAMYHSKDQGKNTYTFFTEGLNESMSRRMALETALYRALDDEALEVHYQPKVDIAAREVAGCEALVRWRGKDGAYVPPPEFIPLAEENGLVTRVDMFVLRSVCRQLRVWRDMGCPLVPVAVNMSARSIMSGGFADRLAGTVRAEGIPPELVEIEVTETSLLSDLDTAAATLSRLHQEGFRIFLDDFGTGYSSLQYLHSMPIACLKIDKKFIDDLQAPQGDSRELVKTIITLASGLGMDTVAEGVEDARQLSFLKASDCHVIQGYIFSRPLPPQEFTEFVLHRRERIDTVLDRGAAA